MGPPRNDGERSAPAPSARQLGEPAVQAARPVLPTSSARGGHHAAATQHEGPRGPHRSCHTLGSTSMACSPHEKRSCNSIPTHLLVHRSTISCRVIEDACGILCDNRNLAKGSGVLANLEVLAGATTRL